MDKMITTSFLKSRKLIFFGVLCCLFFLSGCSTSFEIRPDQWTSNVKNCWPCTLYTAVFNSMGALTVQTYGMACRSALMLLVVGWLFWIAFKTIKMLFSMKQPNFKQFWVDILTVLFKMIVVAAIIGSPDAVIYTLNIILTPIMTAFVELARVVIYADPNIQAIFKMPENFIDMGGTPTADYPLFSQELGAQIQDLIYRVFVMLKGGMYLALYLFKQFTFMSVILSVFLAWAFFVLMILFPFSLVEVFFKIGVVVILAPFVFVAWVFPATKGMVGKAWQIIIGGMIQLLITCTFVAFMMIALTTFTEYLWPGFFSISRQMNDSKTVSDIQQLSVGTFSFFFVVLFIIKFAENINQFTTALGGESAQSEFVRFFTGLKNLVVAGALAVGAMAAQFIPGVGTAMGAAMSAAAKKKAEEGIKQTAELNVKLSSGSKAASQNKYQQQNDSKKDDKKKDSDKKDDKKDPSGKKADSDKGNDKNRNSSEKTGDKGKKTE